MKPLLALAVLAATLLAGCAGTPDPRELARTESGANGNVLVDARVQEARLRTRAPHVQQARRD